jgi:hypothetical protein
VASPARCQYELTAAGREFFSITTHHARRTTNGLIEGNAD